MPDTVPIDPHEQAAWQRASVEYGRMTLAERATTDFDSLVADHLAIVAAEPVGDVVFAELPF